MKYNKVQINALLIHPDATKSIYMITRKTDTYFDYIMYSRNWAEIIYRKNVSSNLWNANDRIWRGLELYKSNRRNHNIIKMCFEGNIDYKDMIWK